MTQKSEFHPYVLKDEPTAIYIMCPERRSSYASPFMSIFYSQLINKIMEYSGNDLPVHMMLDEFANSTTRSTVKTIGIIDKAVA